MVVAHSNVHVDSCSSEADGRTGSNLSDNGVPRESTARFFCAKMIVLSVILMSFAIFAVLYSIKAEIAQIAYYKIKYRGGSVDVALCMGERAHNLYPYNFRLAVWLANTAFRKRLDEQGDEMPARIESMKRWCDTGLELNSHDRWMRMLKTGLMERKSAETAAEYWNEYVNKAFWDPRNHLMLVELYTRAGKLEKAEESLKWAEGAPGYGIVKNFLEDARKKAGNADN